jgi:membrane-bound ClpP family serine protease
MPGYEDLTPDQLMTLAWLAWTGVLMVVIGWVVRAILNFMTARVIQFRIEKEVATSIADKIALKKSWIQQIKIWWTNRKEKKADPMDKYIIRPIEEKLR